MDAINLGVAYNVTMTGLTGNGTPLTSAVVTWSLATGGSSVGNGTMAHSSAGTYVGVIPANLTTTLTPGSRYNLEITSEQSPFSDFRRISVNTGYRGTS